MTIRELEIKLKGLGIKKIFYSLSGGLPSEVFCIDRNESNWEVYYSERGSKSQLKVFEKESEACDYFYKKITSDRVVMGNLENKKML